MNITPSPEYMEAFGRAYDKHGDQVSDHIREELVLMHENGDSILKGITDENEKHKAVAARWPHLYVKG